VKVRLLLDDFNVGDRDQALLALDAHPNIELRVYNPFAQGARGGAGRWLDFIGDFSRLNRRMHNKTFVADASVAIVGGRNIGDEYFDLAEELNFRDRDLLATGPIVARVSANFDAYWNSDHAYPITALADAPAEDTLQTLSRQLEQQIAAAPPLPYLLPENAKAARAVLDNTLAQLVWAEAELVFDQPDKPDDPQTVSANDHVGRKLLELADGVRHELLIESAYLVLAEPANDLIGGLKQRGASVRALTNSLASNDVGPNHAAYIRARQGILQSGAELYELRPDAASCLQLIGSAERCNEDTVFSLHAKSVVFDREILYVGSFNLNQRSVYLNSETALIVHSPQLAQQVAATIEQNMQPQNSWQVVLDEQGRTVWITQQDGHEVRSYQEPAQSGWKRFKADFIALFPLEKYL
jgi:putative cardiolipin synthase